MTLYIDENDFNTGYGIGRSLLVLEQNKFVIGCERQDNTTKFIVKINNTCTNQKEILEEACHVGIFSSYSNYSFSIKLKDIKAYKLNSRSNVDENIKKYLKAEPIIYQENPPNIL